MKRKRLFVGMLAVVLMVLFAICGCASSNETSANESDSQVSASAAESDSASQDASAAGESQDAASAEENDDTLLYEGQSLLVYSGAGLRKPMDEIGIVFNEKYGAQIEYSYAGSAQNLSQIELVQEGDLYIPGAYSYIESAIEKGFVDECCEVIYHIPVIAVPAGNPANITCLEDLANEGVEVVLGDERSAAIGKTAQKMLENKGILEAVEANVVSKDATVNEVVVHITMGQADACIVWEDNVADIEEVEIVEIPEADNQIKIIPIGILEFTENRELAEVFYDFVLSDEGKAIFEKYGFKTIEE